MSAHRVIIEDLAPKHCIGERCAIKCILPKLVDFLDAGGKIASSSVEHPLIRTDGPADVVLSDRKAELVGGHQRTAMETLVADWRVIIIIFEYVHVGLPTLAAARAGKRWRIENPIRFVTSDEVVCQLGERLIDLSTGSFRQQ